MEGLFVQVKGLVVLYGLNIVAAIAILVIGRFAAGAIRSLLLRALKKSNVEPTLVSFITRLVHIILMVFIIIAAIKKLGFDNTSIIAVLGAAGLAVGLALQGSLANLAAGVLMIIFKPFKVGDYIEAAGTAGTVEAVGIFNTELKTPDNKMVIIPNAKATGDNIVNYSAKDQRRIDMVVGVSYGDDLDKVRTVLEQILSEDERILKDPAPIIGVLELSDSSVNFAVRPWVQTSDYWPVFFAAQEKVKKRFDAEGICIPFPQQDVHLYKAE